MTIVVKFFALARDLTGVDEKVLTLPESATVAHVIEALVTQYPRFSDWKDHLRVAVNCEYVPLRHTLHQDAEVAIIPPVSGG